MKIRLSDIMEYLAQNNVTFTVKSRMIPSMATIGSVCALNELKDNSLAWARSVDNLSKEQLAQHDGIWIICPFFEQWEEYSAQGFIFVEDSFSVFFSILDRLVSEEEKTGDCLGSTSVVRTKHLGENVQIGEHCFIGENVVLGDDVVIRNNVSLTGNVRIGRNTTIFSGVVIGEEGFGYFTDIAGNRKRVKHIGGVIIGENCQIGENVVIARGCLGNTILGDNVRVDSLTHIAHNVHIDNGAYVVCLVSLAGSSEVGKNAWIAPGTNVKNQVRIGNNVIIGLGALILKDIPDNAVAVGSPAKVIRDRQPGEEI